jgi:lipoprotein-anchoring transpeptidase ErfK/SrfK
MQPRIVAGLVAFGRVFAVAAHRAPAAAQTNPYFSVDVDERFTGGAPKNKIYSMFGISPIPRSTINFPTKEQPGTIIINTKERRLYLVQADGKAIRYGIGVGRDGFTWRGVKSVTAKKEWPDWTPPAQMLARRPDLPRFMKGGPDNPLGARAMYLGSTLYRIHGSNEPETIGQGVSSGCFRMVNDDVIDLYNRVSLGAKVIVL